MRSEEGARGRIPIALVARMTNKRPILRGILYSRSVRSQLTSPLPPTQCLVPALADVVFHRGRARVVSLNTGMEVAVLLLWLASS